MPAATLPTSQAPIAAPSTRDRSWELGRYHGALEAELNETVRDCNWLKDELKTIKKTSDNLRTMLYNPDRIKQSHTQHESKNSAVAVATPAAAVIVPAKPTKGMETAVVRYMLTSDLTAGPVLQPEYVMATHGKPIGYPVMPVPVDVQRSHSCPMCLRSNKRSNSMRRMMQRRRGGSFDQEHVDCFHDIGYQSTSTSASASSSIIGARPPARAAPPRRRNSAVSERVPPPPPYGCRRRNSAVHSDRSDIDRALESSERKHPRSATDRSSDESGILRAEKDKRIVMPPTPPVIVGPNRISPKEEANQRLREMTAQAMAMAPPAYVAPTAANGLPNDASSQSLSTPKSVSTGGMVGKIAGSGMNYAPPPRATSGGSRTPSVRSSPGTPQKFPAFPQAVPSQQSLPSAGSHRSIVMPMSTSQLSPHSVLSHPSMPGLSSVIIRVDTPNAAALAAGLIPKSTGPSGPSGAAQSHLQGPPDLPEGVSWESIDSAMPLGKGKNVTHDSGSEISSRSGRDGMPATESQRSVLESPSFIIRS